MLRTRPVRTATIGVLFVLPLIADFSFAEEKSEVTQLLDTTCDDSGDGQFAAAERLGDMETAGVAEAIRERLAREKDFHARIALSFALANRGEKEALGELIESLSRSGHLGYVYLCHATDEDFGWNQARWRKWYANTTAKEFRQFVVRRRERRPMMEEFSRFSGVCGAEWFGGLRDAETGDPIPFPESMPIDERERREVLSLPTAKAWSLYEQALKALQSEGDRAEAARLFGEIVRRYPNTYYSDDARELERLLDEMVVEDLFRMFRSDRRPIDKQARIEDMVFRLRDVEAYQYSQPGYCHVVSSFGGEPNAAEELRDIGPDAIPALVAALEDRRPIRAVGYWRNFRPTRVLLRVQDAAIQILGTMPQVDIDEILQSDDVYVRRTTSSYLSTEDPKTREAIATAFSRWDFRKDD